MMNGGNGQRGGGEKKRQKAKGKKQKAKSKRQKAKGKRQKAKIAKQAEVEGESGERQRVEGGSYRYKLFMQSQSDEVFSLLSPLPYETQCHGVSLMKAP